MTQSSTRPDTRHYPNTIVGWNEFDYLNFHNLDAVELASPIITLSPNDLNVNGEATLQGRFETVFHSNLVNLNTYLGNIDVKSACTIGTVGFYDIACWGNTSVYVVGELKGFWNLTNMPTDLDQITILYALSRQNPSAEAELQHRTWWRAIA